MLFTVRELIEGRTEPVSARSSDPVQLALDMMIQHDFSQLPVVDDDQEPRYMVSSDSIVRALNYFGATLPKLRVADAMIPVPTFTLDSDLLQLLDSLRDTNVVLAVDNDRRLAGIVTGYDVTEFFRRQTEDSLLVRDIEQMLRDLILKGLGVTEADLDGDVVAAAIEEITPSNEEQKRQFRKALAHYLKHLAPEAKLPPNEAGVTDAFEAAFPDRPRAKGFNDLTLYEYIQLLLQESRWERYADAFGLDRALVWNALDAVRQTRNDLFHFRGELTATRRAQLRFCREWLGRHHLPTGVQQTGTQEPALPAEISPTPPDSVAPIGEELSPRDSRYALLAVHLQALSQDVQALVLKFGEIEKIIGEQLPPSSRQHRAWWANDPTSQTHSREWLDAGWRVATVDIPGETVEFARSKERQQLYKRFFDDLVSQLGTKALFRVDTHFERDRSWLPVGHLPETEVAIGWLVVSFARLQRVRVEFYVRNEHITVFESLRAEQAEIETEAGDRLSWENIDDRGTRIAMYRSGQIESDPIELEAVKDWVVDALNRLVTALRPRLP